MEIVVQEAKMSGQVILILDEVHRLDKGKQDFLFALFRKRHDYFNRRDDRQPLSCH